MKQIFSGEIYEESNTDFRNERGSTFVVQIYLQQTNNAKAQQKHSLKNIFHWGCIFSFIPRYPLNKNT